MKSRTAAALAFALSSACCAGPAAAALLAQDSFDYPNGSALAGKTGPLGFSAAYAATGVGATLSSPGYSYTDLPVAGNKLNLAGTDSGVFGLLANSPETPGTSVYLSYVMKINSDGGYAGVSLFQGATETLFTGNRGSGPNVFGIEPKVGASANSSASSGALSLVVFRIDFAAAGATIRMYVNPKSNVEPATADLTVTRTSALTYDRLRIQSSGVTGWVDELRMGETFADVAPVTSGKTAQEVVILGSSVAFGVGAAVQSQAWAWRLDDLLENQSPIVTGSNISWQVENASVSGDNTARVISRFQNDVATAHTDANVVVIGLSLANEGLVGASNPQAVFDSFKTGVTQIIDRCRAEGFYPIVSLAYPHNDYTAAEYGYLKKMNLLLNTWDIPSINFLGAIDDGAGHWAAGNFSDSGHPNSIGHGEMFSAVVPSLFDAIAAGKIARPQWENTKGYLRLQRDAAEAAPIRFTPAQGMQSFTLSLRVRSGGVGTIAAVGAGATRATLEIRDNAMVYVGPTGAEMSAVMDANDGRWHDVAIAHRHATGKTLFFVDGLLKGTADDQYIPDVFVVGGAAGASGRALAPVQADYQDVAIYRAAWTPDEASAQNGGALQQASLEICSPLADAAPALGTPLENRAQSLSQLTLHSANITAKVASTTPDGLTAGTYALNTVSLKWNDNGSGANGFLIERRRTGVAEAWTSVGTSPGTSPAFENAGLTSGVSYDYRVSTQDGALEGDYSNVVSIVANGSDARSYQAWIGGFFAADTSVFLIDFNTLASPDYAGVRWNTVTSQTSPTPYPLFDKNNKGTAGYTVAISDSFDQFRSDNGAPLTGYAAAAQMTQFALRDDSPLTGAITFAGLDPSATYDFTFFARRGSIVAGFDYSGIYTFTGSGSPVAVEVNANMNTALTNVPAIKPSAAGVVVLRISAGPGTGSDFPVINFIQMSRSGGDPVYTAKIDPNADPDGDGIKNFEEYALNLNPTLVDTKRLGTDGFAMKDSGANVELKITRDRRAKDAGYVLERTTDLVNWNTDATAVQSVFSAAGPKEVLSFTSAASEPKLFFRVRLKNNTTP